MKKLLAIVAVLAILTAQAAAAGESTEELNRQINANRKVWLQEIKAHLETCKEFLRKGAIDAGNQCLRENREMLRDFVDSGKGL
jgi:hypothetical protein